MGISISKKFSGKQRAIIKEVLRLAKADFDLSDLRSLRISPMNKLEREQFGAYASSAKGKALIKLNAGDSNSDFIENLAHELAHIGQFAEHRLLDSEYFAIWNLWFFLPHVLLRFQPYGDVKYNPFYWFAPWEREARAYARKIMVEINGTGP